MEISRCYRCGKIIDDTQDFVIEFGSIAYIRNVDIRRNLHIQKDACLCKKCSEEFFDWVAIKV